MAIKPRCFLLLVIAFLSSLTLSARRQSASQKPGAASVVLDAAVTDRSGTPVSGLSQQDFSLFDNDSPQTISSFQAVKGTQAQIEVIVLVDAVNVGYAALSYERGQIAKFLMTDSGHLAHPTTLAFLSGTGTQIEKGFSDDGNLLSTVLEHYNIDLRNVPRSATFYGASDRYRLSLECLQELAVHAASLPGRKIILWVSPGWPLLTGPNAMLDVKQLNGIFSNIVGFSTLLRRAHITLYSIDPLGATDLGYRTFDWRDYVKGVSKPSQVQAENLALEVLATQSGGLALNSSNDVAQLLERCVADMGVYYEISFEPPASEQRRQYHHLEIRLAKPGLSARTRQGYYSQP